jgi:hypothetical protein
VSDDLESLRKDAARYRWLRDCEDAHAAYSAAFFNAGAEFDRWIDDSMRDQAEAAEIDEADRRFPLV